MQIAGIAVLPFGKGKQFLNAGVASAVAGGWQLNAILSFFSGTPFSVLADGTSLNAPGSTQRADQIKSNVPIYGAGGNGKLYFDTTAFAPVTAARFGTASYDSLRGPGAANADVGLFRSFRLFERLTAEARVEAMNVTNTPHFANPNSNVSTGGFGTITSVSPISRIDDERYLRFGLKFSF
jgi:hypothetical protein